jgi:hypothetical protein
MIRVQLRLHGNAEQIFSNLVSELQSGPKDVVLDGLALLHFAAEQIRGGRKIGSYDPESKEFTALTTPSLESLGARSRASHRTPAVGA